MSFNEENSFVSWNCFQEIAAMFMTVGMCNQAVDAYIKVNNVMNT